MVRRSRAGDHVTSTRIPKLLSPPPSLHTTMPAFSELHWLDRLAIMLPHYVYRFNDAYVRLPSEVLSFVVMIGLATGLVVLGSFLTLSRPKNAKDANKAKTSPLWDPTDRDDSPFYQSLVVGLETLHWTTFGVRQAYAVPVLAASVLCLIYYFLKNYDSATLTRYFNWYVLVLGVFPVYVTLHGVVSAILRQLTHLLGLPGNSAFFFPRYRLTLTADDHYPLGTVENVGHASFKGKKSTAESKSWYRGFRRFLKQNKVKVLKPTDVAVKKQIQNWIFDAKPLIVVPLTVLSIYSFYRFNPVLNTSYNIGAVSANWLIINLISLNLAVFGIKAMALSNFRVGAILLAGLFVYDIYFVFGTPVMVAVATGLDIPIKILIPRKPVYDLSLLNQAEFSTFHNIPTSLLGLGDIVLPGALIALTLRFDLHRHYNMHKSQSYHHLRAFRKPYFTAAVFSYAVGLVATTSSLYLSDKGQPALLYLVPSLFLGIFGLAFVRGEVDELWAYNEEIPEYKENSEEEKDEIEEVGEGFTVTGPSTMEFELEEDEELDTDYSASDIDESYDEWEAKIEEHRSFLDETDEDEDEEDEEETADGDVFVRYEFQETDDDRDDDTFMVEIDSDLESELERDMEADLESDEMSESEIDVLKTDTKSAPVQWYD